MTAISRRSPPVDIEYDCRGKRKRKSFPNAHAGRAFFGLKLKAGKNPKICKPSVAYFSDDNGTPVTKEEATNVEILEFDENDRNVMRTYGTL
jgi:hypothetical protein